MMMHYHKMLNIYCLDNEIFNQLYVVHMSIVSLASKPPLSLSTKLNTAQFKMANGLRYICMELLLRIIMLYKPL